MSVEALVTASSRSPIGASANRIRQMTIQRGIDPRGLRTALVRRRRPGAVGRRHGSHRHDGLHRAANPGNLSAFGLLAVDWRTDHIVTKVMQQDAADAAWLSRRSTGASNRTRPRRCDRDGIDSARIRPAAPGRCALMSGQSMEVRVDAAGRRESMPPSSTGSPPRSTPPIARPSAMIMPASSRSNSSISACPASA